MHEMISFFQKTSGIQVVVYALINFIILVMLLWRCRYSVIEALKGLYTKIYLILFILLIIEIIMHIYMVSPKHIMYIDEFWYMKAAKNILFKFNIYDCPKPIAWPFLIAWSFLFCGVNNYVAIYLSIFFGALIFFNIFLITFLLSRDKYISLAASAVFIFIPYRLFWSSTADANIPSLYFVTLSIFFSLLYYQKCKTDLLWLSVISWAFTCQIRAENYAFFILFILGIFIFIKPLPKLNLNFILPFITGGILCFSGLIRALKFYSAENWFRNVQLTRSNISFNNFISNSLNCAPEIFNNVLHPWIFSIVFILGIAYCFRYAKKQAIFLLSWFLILYIIYFSSWELGLSSFLPPKTRFYLFFYPILVIFYAYGLYIVSSKGRIYKIIALLILICTICLFAPYYKNYPLRNSLFELVTEIVSRTKHYIPSDCIIVSDSPCIIDSVNLYKTVEIESFLNDALLRNHIFSSSNCILTLSCEGPIYSWHKYHLQGTLMKLKNKFYVEPYLSFNKNKSKCTYYKISNR